MLYHEHSKHKSEGRRTDFANDFCGI